MPHHTNPLLLNLLLLLLLLLTILPTTKSNLYENDPNVQTFTNKSDFNKRVIQSSSVWIIQFYAPWCGHCQKLSPDYKALATILKGVVQVGAVDAATEDAVGQKRIAAAYEVKGFPTLYILGEDKNKANKYEGKRDLQSLVQECMNEVGDMIHARAKKLSGAAGSAGGTPTSNQTPPPSSSSKTKATSESAVVKLHSSNFATQILQNTDVSLVAFIAPWCGHCKALLPEWEAASIQLLNTGVTLGVVDATVETDLASKYGVNGYPTIKVFAGGNANKDHGDAMDYEGGRTESDIVRVALEEADRSGVPLEIPQLVNEEVLDMNCRKGRNHICVLVGLPHILESSAERRNQYKENLSMVAKSFRGQSFGFVWFEGGSQPELEQVLGLTFGFPAVAAVSLEKGVYAVQKGSYSVKNVRTFLTSITVGRQVTMKFDGLPKINEVEPWDGKDGAVVEEEFSLDDIMGEEF